MPRPTPFNSVVVDHLLTTADWYKTVLAYMVVLSYVLWTIALVIIIWRGYKKKSYGMPGLSVAATLSLCFFTGWVGPWAEECLFFANQHWYLIWTWRLWAVLNLFLYVQYIWHGRKGVSEPLASNFTLYALSLVGVCALTQWTFIIFYQDFYVNVACPLLCVLPMAAGYFMTPFTHKNLDALSIPGAWLLTIGTTLLYLAVVLNDMAAPYPGHQQTGYLFIYWIYGLTVAMLYAYTIVLIEKRRVFRRAEEAPATAAPEAA